MHTCMHTHTSSHTHMVKNYIVLIEIPAEFGHQILQELQLSIDFIRHSYSCSVHTILCQSLITFYYANILFCKDTVARAKRIHFIRQ